MRTVIDRVVVGAATSRQTTGASSRCAPPEEPFPHPDLPPGVCFRDLLQSERSVRDGVRIKTLVVQYFRYPAPPGPPEVWTREGDGPWARQ